MTVVASSAPARMIIPSQRDAVSDILNEDIEYVEEFFKDTDPSVIEPTREIISAREHHEIKVRRRQNCRMKAAQKPRNRMLREVAEQNARITENGGGIKKPKLPKEAKQRIRKGEVPSDLHLYHVTRYWKLRIKEIKQRKAKAKQSKKVALAIA